MNKDERILDGKRVVVVGGGGLLGAKICAASVAAGASCAIADTSRERAELVSSHVHAEHGIKPAVIEMTISEASSVDLMIEEVSRRLGGVDALVNAAYPRNKQYGARFEDVTYSGFCENVNLHLGGYFLVSQRILEYFKKNGGGCLLNISSVYGVVAPRFQIYSGTAMTMPVEYAAIKAALIHLTKYMAKYYAGSGIRTNCLSLGGLYDNQPEEFVKNYREFCLDKGMLDPDDVVGAILFLLSDKARYVNGQNLIVDDGFSL